MRQSLEDSKLRQLRWHRAILLGLALFLTSNSTASASVTPQPEMQVAAAMQELRDFNSTHSLSTLRTAIGTMYSSINTQTIAPQDLVTIRRSRMQAWAKILQAIEQSYDPTYNPNDPRQMPVDCVACTFPQGRPTADQQAAYEAAVQANNAKEARVQHYLQVQRLDDRAMASIHAELWLFEMAGAPPDYAALDAIFRQAGLSAARVSKIDTMLKTPSDGIHS